MYDERDEFSRLWEDLGCDRRHNGLALIAHVMGLVGPIVYFRHCVFVVDYGRVNVWNRRLVHSES